MNEADSAASVAEFQCNGALLLPGAFREWVITLRDGAEKNFQTPGPRVIRHSTQEREGRFIEDFCNWQRIPEYEDFIRHSPMADIAATLMKSQTVQFFHDHYLHKESGSHVATPWHQDMPYYCIDGYQTVSFWIPLNPVNIAHSLKCVAGSQAWPKLIRPTSWSSNESFYADDSSFMDLPDIDNEAYDIRTWTIEPGDAIAFDFRTIHSANANTEPTVKQTLSFRLLGDDVRYYQRPGRTSPDFPNIGHSDGDRLREDWFPMLVENGDSDERRK